MAGQERACHDPKYNPQNRFTFIAERIGVSGRSDRRKCGFTDAGLCNLYGTSACFQWPALFCLFFHCILQCKHMDDRINVEGGPFTGNILMFPPLANGEVVEGRAFFYLTGCGIPSILACKRVRVGERPSGAYRTRSSPSGY